jgi:hypothetical protein
MAKRRGLVYGFPPSLPGQTQRRPISRVSGVKLFVIGYSFSFKGRRHVGSGSSQQSSIEQEKLKGAKMRMRMEASNRES